MDTKTQDQIDSLNVAAADLQKVSQTKYAELEAKGAALGQTLEEEKNRVTDLEKKFSVIEKKAARNKAIIESNKDIEAEMKSFNSMMAKNGKSERFEDVESLMVTKALVEKAIRYGDKYLSHEEVKSLNGIVSPDGGYLVGVEVTPSLAAKVFDSRQFGSAVTNTTVGTSTYREFIDWGEYADAQNESQLEATGVDLGNNDIRQIDITVGETYYPKQFSRSVLEDADVNLDVEVMGSVSKGIMRKEAQAMLTGTGATNDPIRGLLTYDAGTDFGQIQQITSETSGVFDWDDVLENLPAALIGDFHGNAKFLMQRATFFSLLTAKDSQGKYQIGNQINFFDNNLSLNLMSYPVLFDAGMPTVSAGTLAVAFGDFAETYRKVNRIGYAVHRDDSNAKFVTLTGRKRSGGGVKQWQATKLLKIQA